MKRKLGTKESKANFSAQFSCIFYEKRRKRGYFLKKILPIAQLSNIGIFYFTFQVFCGLIIKNKGGDVTTIYEQILAEYQQIETNICAIEHKLESLPEGKIFCTHNGKYFKWYHGIGDVRTYIPKEDRGFAEQLALKKYLLFQLKDLKQEKIALEFYLKHHVSRSEQLHELFAEDSGYKELLDPYYKSISQELQEWMELPFEQNPNYPEQLIHKTVSGKLVRSKSESMIDMFLYMNKIPFHYEEKLMLGKTILYPDFTIRHPKTGETFYWEHYGLMDDPAYYQNAFSKLQLYTSHGIIPSVHLITTYETKENPLSADTVEKIVKHYFC